jgi:hypothetical protein
MQHTAVFIFSLSTALGCGSSEFYGDDSTATWGSDTGTIGDVESLDLATPCEPGTFDCPCADQDLDGDGLVTPGGECNLYLACINSTCEESTRDLSSIACVSADGVSVYLVYAPESCRLGDKFACKAGNYDDLSTSVCCNVAGYDCYLVQQPGLCAAADKHMCDAVPPP